LATHFDAVPEMPSTLTLDDSLGVPSSASTSCSLMPSRTLPKLSSLIFEHAAAASQLEHWAVAVLDAASVEEVFAR